MRANSQPPSRPPTSRLRRAAGDLYRYAATLQGWSFVALLTLLLGGVAAPLARLLEPRWPALRDSFADLTHRVLAFYQRHVMYMRIQVEHAERRVEGTRILVANHQSWLDPLVLMGIERRLAGPVRRYMLAVPIFGAIPRLAGFYPAEVGDLPSFDEVARCVERARERGGSVLFFPEGTRGRELGPFHRGAFRAALDHDLPIQPLVIEGLDRVLPRDGPVVQLPGRTCVRVRYLDAIAPPRVPDERAQRREAVRELCARTRGAIAEELAAMQAERDAG